MIRLSNERLAIEIAEPGTFYNGPRYDWTGFITQVTLDDEHTFCSPESLNGEGSGGAGLCNEFGIFRPIGYVEAHRGECFPKLGVGLLTKVADGQFGETLPKLGVGLLTKVADGQYDFAEDYPFTPFPIHTRHGENEVEFTSEPLSCRGYAARLRKRISLRETTLRIDYELENSGEKPLVSHEYCHNFLSVNGDVPGPNYALQIGEGIKLHHTPASVSCIAGEVRWSETPPKPFLIQSSFLYAPDSRYPVWQLRHLRSGAVVSESIQGAVSHFALWCAPHVVSPEVFVDIDLAPGETTRWARCYEFSSEK